MDLEHDFGSIMMISDLSQFSLRKFIWSQDFISVMHW